LRGHAPDAGWNSAEFLTGRKRGDNFPSDFSIDG
jgi:hypothetical protein